MIYLLTPIVIQSEAKNLGNIYVKTLLYATEILPPFGRLNDKWYQEVYCSQNKKSDSPPLHKRRSN